MPDTVYLRGTLSVEDGVATVKVDMIAAEPGVIQNPFNVLKALSQTAKSEGATILRLKATVVNPKLQNVLQNRYQMTTINGQLYFEIPLTP